MITIKVQNSIVSGKIGSDMGLFYGASVISLFEVILMLFKTLWALISPSRATYLKEKAKQEVSKLIRLANQFRYC